MNKDILEKITDVMKVHTYKVDEIITAKLARQIKRDKGDTV